MTEELEEGIETPYLSEEVHLSKITPIHVLYAMTKITAWQNFTHHPTCSKYKNHYFKIGKLKLCVGCTGLYSGIIMFLILYFAVPSIKRNPIALPIVFLSGCFAVVLHFLIHPKNKWLKVFLRFCFGIGIGAYISIIILGPKWWLRAIFTAIFLVGISLFTMIRGAKANLELCNECSLHFADPPCDPMKNTEIRVKKINEIVDAQLEKYAKRKEKPTVKVITDEEISENDV